MGVNMIDDFDDQPTIIELHTCFSELLYHVVGDGSIIEVLNKDAHLRVIAKAAMLLLKPEVCRIKVHNQGGWAAVELLQDVTFFGY